MDLISLPIESNNLPADSRYRLVIMASHIARALMEGREPEVNSRYLKETTTALEEILKTAPQYLTGKEARGAFREARRIREEHARQKAMLEKMEEVSAELRKDLATYVDDSQSPPVEENGESV
jgi:DNA-directed RNA polymerase subunit omega